jgi:L-seryl-tRNA(Ser) seleniumtransferase
VSQLLAELTGAEKATVVNNNAGATLITLAALAGGREVIVARGQLVEIGGSFRLPEVMAQSGARLVEVGTTNKVYLSDYERAITPATALLMVVHTSNFRVVGFTEEPALADLVALGRKHGVPVFHDVGSGALVDFGRFGIQGEPVVGESIAAGADVICFSGDKLLGGPQAGIVLGRRNPVDRVRKHPLFRALRPDKVQLTALEATLQHYRNPDTVFESVPTLRMVSMTDEELKVRARKLVAGLKAIAGSVVDLWRDCSQLGGGSTPGQDLPTWVAAMTAEKTSAQELHDALRRNDPPIFARVKKDRCLLDPRTLQAGEDVEVIKAVRRILA